MPRPGQAVQYSHRNVFTAYARYPAHDYGYPAVLGGNAPRRVDQRVRAAKRALLEAVGAVLISDEEGHPLAEPFVELGRFFVALDSHAARRLVAGR